MINARERYLIWLVVSITIFALSAMYQAILQRPTEISWLKIHALFWATRDLPLAVWAVIWWAWPVFRYSGRDAKLWVVSRVVFAIAAHWFIFNEVYQWAQEHQEYFYGGPDKPCWFFW